MSHDIQKALKPVYPLVPDMLALCTDHRFALMGCDFYGHGAPGRHQFLRSQSAVRGLNLSREQARMLCQRAIDGLIDLHSVDVQAAGLSELGKGEGYNRRQIGGWSERLRKAKTWNVMSGKPGQ